MKRALDVATNGYDSKFLYHTVRLINEIEQILTEGDLDPERNREQLKSIRNGEWTAEQGINYFNTKEKELETLYTNSKLPWGSDEKKIKELLLSCLEQYFGSLDNIIKKDIDINDVLRDFQEVIYRYQK